jgi:hypothetical protein
LIGLSPLGTAHPDLFQQVWVRPSSACYRTFSLAMPRSLGFGSDPTNCKRPLQTRFRCASAYRLKLARETKSLTHYTKGTPSPVAVPEGTSQAPTVCRRPVSGTVSLPLSGCFSPFPHGTGSLSVSKEYLAFEGGPPIFGQDFTCPALLDTSSRDYAYGAVTHIAQLPSWFCCLSRLGWSAFARRY